MVQKKRLSGICYAIKHSIIYNKHLEGGKEGMRTMPNTIKPGYIKFTEDLGTVVHNHNRAQSVHWCSTHTSEHAHL